jgi:thiol-disulfide isomerase/thioredoxin
MDKKASWLKKNWSNLLWLTLIALLLFPPTGKPIKIAVHRLIAFSPKTISAEKQETLASYDWLLKNEDGRMVDFNAFKGKPVIVNFWATWCPPCIAEMPSLEALYKDYGEEVEFLFVTNDDTEKVETFLANRNVEIPVFYQATKAPELLQTNSLPTTYLIDKDGSVIIKKVGSADWNSNKVRALLDQELD